MASSRGDGLHRLRGRPSQVGAFHLDQVRSCQALVVLGYYRVERVLDVLAVLVVPVVFDQACRRQAVAVGCVNCHDRPGDLLASHMF